MKKLVFLSLFILLALGSKINAQSLEFSQVVNIFHHITNGPTSYTTDSMTIVVPAGKVWKVTSAACSQFYAGGTSYRTESGDNHVALNGVIIGSGIITAPLPIWLAVGSYDLYFQGNSTTSTLYSWECMLSILEFNVVP